MKMFLSLALVLTVAPSAFATKLTSLECLAANGVTIRTEKETRKGVAVVSAWGLLTKKFTATLGLAGYETESYVDLENSEGEVLYTISLDLNPERSTAQTSAGVLSLPAKDLASEPTVLTAVRCKVELSQED